MYHGNETVNNKVNSSGSSGSSTNNNNNIVETQVILFEEPFMTHNNNNNNNHHSNSDNSKNNDKMMICNVDAFFDSSGDGGSCTAQPPSLFVQLPKDIIHVIFSFCDLHSNIGLSSCSRDLYSYGCRNDIWMYILSHDLEVNKNVNHIFKSYHRKAKRGRLNQLETELMKKTGNEFLKFIQNGNNSETFELDKKFCYQVKYRMHEAIEDDLNNVNYKKQYVDLMRNHSQAVETRRMRKQEKVRRQNRLFSVATVTFLALLLCFVISLVCLGLYMDGVIKSNKGRAWLVPYIPLICLLIPSICYSTAGFPIALRWNPIVHQNYFQTLSKHTKNYFVLSLAHFWWVVLLILLIGIKMTRHQGTPIWSHYLIPIYCCWALSVMINFVLAVAVHREQGIEIKHLKGLLPDNNNNIRKIKKIERAIDCAKAKISCSRVICFTLLFSYSCLLISTALSLRKYDSELSGKPAIKARYSLLFIPVFAMIMFWIFVLPVILRHIVYILLGSPTPATGMDFFRIARFIFVAITSMCTEIIVMPVFVSVILLGLRIDNLIKIQYIWVFSPIYCTFFIVLCAFGLFYLKIMGSLIKNRM